MERKMGLAKRPKKVMVGLSGGVDSSVAAYLLKKQGHEVIGVFIKIFDEELAGAVCPWLADLKLARQVASQLKIPFYVFDLSDDYRRDVLTDFFREYRAGRTPNPDVRCNKFIKFGRFLALADKVGADYLATGHYVIREGNLLYRAKDRAKDQSYFLWMLSQEQIKRSLFPLGGWTKDKVRALARKLGLVTADRPDSQGVCFLGQIKVSQILEAKFRPTPGKIYLGKEEIGIHSGVQLYTIGQKLGGEAKLKIKGSSLAGQDIPAFFVIAKDMRENILQVGRADDPGLFSRQLLARQVNWIGIDPTKGLSLGKDRPFYQARIRYGQPLQNIRDIVTEGRIRVRFEQSQRAITPGQSIVFYQGEQLLGGALIEKSV